MAPKKREAKQIQKKEKEEEKKSNLKEVTVSQGKNGEVVDTFHPQAL